MWIGLILTVILLSEAVTGLILAEPWMIGETEEEQSITKIEQGQEDFMKEK